MTYRELAEKIQSFDDDKKDRTVTVWNVEEDEFYGVQSSGMTSECDIFDKGQFILCIKGEPESDSF